MSLYEPTIDDLKQRLDIRGSIIAKQADRIQELVQKIQQLEKELVSCKAIASEQVLRIFQDDDDQLSPEQLLAEKQALEELLDNKNQEILVLIAKLEGLGSVTPTGEGSPEEIALDNIRLQEQLKEAKEALDRLQDTGKTNPELILKIQHLERELAKFKAIIAEQEIQIYQTGDDQVSPEHLFAEKQALEELLDQKNQEILAYASKLEELGLTPTISEEDLGKTPHEYKKLQEQLTEAKHEINQLKSAATLIQKQTDIENRLKEQLEAAKQEIEQLKSAATLFQEQLDTDMLVEDVQSQTQEDLKHKTVLEEKLQHQIQENEQLIIDRQELGELLARKDEEIATMSAQLLELNNRLESVKKPQIETQEDKLQSEIERLQEEFETERQELLRGKRQLEVELAEKSSEADAFRTDLDQFRVMYEETKDLIEKITSEEKSAQEPSTVQLQESAQAMKPEIRPFLPPQSTELSQETSVLSKTLTSRKIAAAPSSVKIITPGEWFRHDLKDIFESFLYYLTQEPSADEIIDWLEQLRDILFERKGGGSAVRRCAQEIQSLKRGVISSESLKNALRDMAHILGVHLSL